MAKMIQTSELIRIYVDTKTGNCYPCMQNENCEPTKYVFDSVTKLIYYKFEENGVGYMSPYYTNSGGLGRFIF